MLPCKKRARVSEEVTCKPDIRLNVGGVVYTVGRQALVSHPDSFFGAMFSCTSCLRPAAQDDSGAFIVERSPDSFIYVVRYLSGDCDLQLGDLSEAGLAKLVSESDFYQLLKLKRIAQDELNRRRKASENELQIAKRPLQVDVRRLKADLAIARQSLDATQHDLERERKRGTVVCTFNPNCGIVNVGDRVRAGPDTVRAKEYLASGTEGTIIATSLDRGTEMAVKWDDGTVSRGLCGGKRGQYDLVFL